MPLLDQGLSVLFYELTTVRISGISRIDGDLRAHGLRKESGTIARQFVLGVVGLNQTAAPEAAPGKVVTGRLRTQVLSHPDG